MKAINIQTQEERDAFPDSIGTTFNLLWPRDSAVLASHGWREWDGIADNPDAGCRAVRYEFRDVDGFHGCKAVAEPVNIADEQAVQAAAAAQARLADLQANAEAYTLINGLMLLYGQLNGTNQPCVLSSAEVLALGAAHVDEKLPQAITAAIIALDHGTLRNVWMERLQWRPEFEQQAMALLAAL